MIAFVIDYLILVLGIPLQVLGIIAAFSLKGQKVPALSTLILVSSFIIFITLAGFLTIEALESFSGSNVFTLLNDEELITAVFGLWALGMAGQLVGLLLVCLRFKKQAERLTLLEAISAEQFLDKA
ncbi:MAG: hypothetical protein ACSHYB_15095 [Roseibacillus sp.]